MTTINKLKEINLQTSSPSSKSHLIKPFSNDFLNSSNDKNLITANSFYKSPSKIISKIAFSMPSKEDACKILI